MDVGTFLLMQSPSMHPSQEIYARGVEQAQAVEALGYRNAWLGEHHFSTYGYLSRPAQLATCVAAPLKILLQTRGPLKRHKDKTEHGLRS